MLSSRAKRLLERLERRPAIETADVESIIRAQGYPCLPIWLEFHDRYAGYVEVFGRDCAVWGLVHENPEWLLPRKAEIDREPNEETWYITCADAHPSYSYRLDNRGEFLGDPAVSFDVHVERVATFAEFQERVPCRALAVSELRSQAVRDVLLNELYQEPVTEASDQFFRYYMNDAYLLVEDAETRELRRGLTRM